MYQLKMPLWLRNSNEYLNWFSNLLVLKKLLRTLKSSCLRKLCQLIFTC